MRSAPFVLVMLLVACPPPRVEPPRVEPPAPPPPPPLRVPEGCLGLQVGGYLVDGQPQWRVAGSDDGGVLTLLVTALESIDAGRPPRRFRRDGGLAWLVEPDAGSSIDAPTPRLVGTFVLTRGADGFGGTFSPSPLPACGPFPALVVDCAGDALEVGSPKARAASCEVPDAGWGRLRFVRLPSEDAGTDGGRDTVRESDGGTALLAPDP